MVEINNSSLTDQSDAGYQLRGWCLQADQAGQEAFLGHYNEPEPAAGRKNNVWVGKKVMIAMMGKILPSVVIHDTLNSNHLDQSGTQLNQLVCCGWGSTLRERFNYV